MALQWKTHIGMDSRIFDDNTTMKRYKIVLSIAGSDSGGCAGIQADIKTISANGCFATTAITAITAQNTTGVADIHNIPPEMVRRQIRAVLEDIGADAVKLGMLPSAAIVEAVAEELRCFGTRNIVLDPVMVATSGDELIPPDAAKAIIALLLPLAAVITPNIPETGYITGLRIDSEEHFPAAAAALKELGARAVLLKAGHLQGPVLTDHLWDAAGGRHTYSFGRIDTSNTHGTGCTLSSAIASQLALGYPLPEAVAKAEEYVHNAIQSGADYKTGHGNGPVNHLWKST